LSLITVDGIFLLRGERNGVDNFFRNRPIVIDSRRNHEKSESREFLFEIKSEKF
jgi:hypothetical protein